MSDTTPPFLYLDIDGVLVKDSAYAGVKTYKELNELDPVTLIDREAVARLNRVADRFEIILSSRWYPKFSVNKVQSFLASAGFTGTLAGVTEERKLSSYKENEIRWHRQSSQENFERPYLILDDEKFRFGAFPEGNIIQTDPELGLTDEDLDKILKFLETVTK